MPSLQWNEKFANGLPRMDDTHREFVEHYNAVAEATPETFLDRFDAFIAHTEAHFDQENRWMEAVDFPGCHRAEHERVLVVLRDIRKRVAAGDLFFARRLMEELPAWFDNHTNGMDAALAFHLQSVGYDVVTERFAETGTDEAKESSARGCACATLTAENAS
jgi:hemerythrin